MPSYNFRPKNIWFVHETGIKRMKTETLLRIEKQIGENLVDYLHREYHQNFGRLVNISKNLGIHRTIWI